MVFRRTVLMCGALACAALFTSCTSVRTATEDAVAWVRGALQTNLNHPLERSTKAATAAMKDLKFVSIAARQDALTGLVTARTAKDELVEITLTALGPKATRIDIRVGTFNDKTAAYQVLSAINRRL